MLKAYEIFVYCMLKGALELRCKGLALQVKLLLQPLKGQDPVNSRPLCLLDVLSSLKPIREGVIHAILSTLVDISCPIAIAAPEPEGAQSMAKQLEASEPGIEALKPPLAEPRAGKSTTEDLRGTPCTLQPIHMGITLSLPATACASALKQRLLCAQLLATKTPSCSACLQTVQRKGRTGGEPSNCTVSKRCRWIFYIRTLSSLQRPSEMIHACRQRAAEHAAQGAHRAQASGAARKAAPPAGGCRRGGSQGQEQLVCQHSFHSRR